ncbi:hypothetical protein ACB092_05G258000 [Castanea dentata]
MSRVEKFPGEGSSALFQEVRNRCKPVFTSQPSFIPVLPSLPSIRTKFPESKSFAIVTFIALDDFEDHIVGFSLFATQTIVSGLIFLNQIPKYRFSELPGLKNPSTKLSPEETSSWPSTMD